MSAELTLIERLEKRVAELEADLRWRTIRGQPNCSMARAYHEGRYNPDSGPFVEKDTEK